MKSLLNKYRNHIIFIFIFSVVFFLMKTFFLYFLPFIVGAFVSLVMYPVYSFMKRRLSFKPAFSATVITLFIFSVVLSLVIFSLFLIVKESVNLYYNNQVFLDGIIEQIDFLDTIKELDISNDLFSRISDTAFGIVRIIPITITLLIISFVSTVCFINNLPVIVNSILLKLNEKYREDLKNVIFQFKSIFRKFVKSYIILYCITFIESLFIFVLIDLDYKLVFAFLASVSDVLPILGPGTVYLPIAVVKALSGDYLSSVTLLVFWGIVIVIRQIIEPKLLSDSVKIHPLVILSALYFSIVSSYIWVLLYVITIALIYKILIESKILYPIFLSHSIDSSK